MDSLGSLVVVRHGESVGSPRGGGDGLRPRVRGGRYLDPEAARAEALVIARQGGT